MIVGLGVDIVDMERIMDALERWGDRFVNRFCTDTEVSCWHDTGAAPSRLAGRFAAKEAAMKALGVGWGSAAGWKDFEITNDERGCPSLSISGRAAETANSLGVGRTLITISHSQRSACAVVIMEA